MKDEGLSDKVLFRQNPYGFTTSHLIDTNFIEYHPGCLDVAFSFRCVIPPLDINFEYIAYKAVTMINDFEYYISIRHNLCKRGDIIHSEFEYFKAPVYDNLDAIYKYKDKLFEQETKDKPKEIIDKVNHYELTYYTQYSLERAKQEYFYN